MSNHTPREEISPLLPSTWPTLGSRVFAPFGDITETGLVIEVTGEGWTGTKLLVDWEDSWRGEFAEGAKWFSLCNLRNNR